MGESLWALTGTGGTWLLVLSGCTLGADAGHWGLLGSAELGSWTKHLISAGLSILRSRSRSQRLRKSLAMGESITPESAESQVWAGSHFWGPRTAETRQNPWFSILTFACLLLPAINKAKNDHAQLPQRAPETWKEAGTHFLVDFFPFFH